MTKLHFYNFFDFVFDVSENLEKRNVVRFFFVGANFFFKLLLNISSINSINSVNARCQMPRCQDARCPVAKRPDDQTCQAKGARFSTDGIILLSAQNAHLESSSTKKTNAPMRALPAKL